MAHYLVSAQPRWELLPELRQRLDSGAIRALRPFGATLDHSLRDARLEEGGMAIWEEEDYCRPPLAMERAAVLDHFFDAITTAPVDQGAGWSQVEGLPSLWEAGPA